MCKDMALDRPFDSAFIPNQTFHSLLDFLAAEDGRLRKPVLAFSDLADLQIPDWQLGSLSPQSPEQISPLTTMWR